MSSEYGVFVRYPGNIWKNANDNLDIRHSTVNGKFDPPTIDTVPRVFTYNSKHQWEQIYPATEKKSGRITYSASVFDHYKYCRTDGVNWGWDGRRASAGHGYFEQDWIDSGGQDMTLVKKEYMGWMDMGSRARSKFPDASKVKEITFLRITVNRRNMTGLTGEPCILSFVLNNCDAPGGRLEKYPNPFSTLVGSHVSAFEMPSGSGRIQVTINLGTSNGRALADLFKRWMRGEAKSIMLYNNERKADNRQWGRYGKWSRNYTKITSFTVDMEYTTEG